VEGLRTWSVGRDDGVVTALLPEPLRFPSGPLPEWMGRCAAAIRDALRELPITEGSLLEATLSGVSEDADLGDALLSNVRVPEAQVHAGVRMRRAASPGPGVIQTYRRVPLVGAACSDADEEPESILASLRIPLQGVYELDTERLVWLAVRRAVVAALPAAGAALPGDIELSARLVAETQREPVTTELLARLIEGIRLSFRAHEGEDLEETSRRLTRAAELRTDAAEVNALLRSPNGTLLAADARFAAVEVLVTSGPQPQLSIELRPVRRRADSRASAPGVRPRAQPS
jgi:hypothetical protein